MSPEGKPIQVNASALQAASAQGTMGMLKMRIDETVNFQELSINCEGKILFSKIQRWYNLTRHVINRFQISKFWRRLV